MSTFLLLLVVPPALLPLLSEVLEVLLLFPLLPFLLEPVSLELVCEEPEPEPEP